jgi:O-methyltransferase domain/Dimerisation domain
MTNPSAQTAADINIREQMLQMMSGLWVTRGIYVAAKLGIADLLKDGQKTAEQLAAATKSNADALYRVLRMLGSVGIFTESDDRRFSLTPLSETLLSDIPGSLRPGAIAELGEVHYDAWGNIMHSVKTGGIAFDDHFGMNVWQYFEKDPAKADNFNRYMAGSSEPLNRAVSTGYDFNHFEKIVDVGGGLGGMISAILSENPHLKGVVFDAPSVVGGSKDFLAERGLSERCDTIGGDFFEFVPAGGDLYTMRWILHDWDDEKSLIILRNIHKVLPANGKLLLAEAVVPSGTEPHFSKFFDLIMLTMTGGRERTEIEWKTLLEKAGFKIERIIPTESFLSIIEAVPVQ